MEDVKQTSRNTSKPLDVGLFFSSCQIHAKRLMIKIRWVCIIKFKIPVILVQVIITHLTNEIQWMVSVFLKVFVLSCFYIFLVKEF